MTEHVADDVCAHLQRFKMLLGRVVVYGNILPAVAQIALVAEEAD